MTDEEAANEARRMLASLDELRDRIDNLRRLVKTADDQLAIYQREEFRTPSRIDIARAALTRALEEF